MTLTCQADIIDVLESYTPSMEGLLNEHASATGQLERLVFDEMISKESAAAAALLYGTLRSYTPGPF